VAEWFKAAVLKTAVVKATGGSNPSSSANEIGHDFAGNLGEACKNGARSFTRFAPNAEVGGS
jgi:hypothetical protein